MKLEKSFENQKVIVSFEGYFTQTELKNMKELLNDCLKYKDIKDFVFDMKNVPFINSSGLGCLMFAYKTLKGAGNGFVLKGVNHQVKSVLKLTRLEKIIPVYEN